MNETDLDIESVVQSVLEDELSPAKVVDVRVFADQDSTGDDVLRIDIVFKVEGDQLDPERVLGLVRHLREPLAKIEERRFPILSFMTQEEAGAAA